MSIDGVNYLKVNESSSGQMWGQFQIGYPSIGLPPAVYTNVTNKLKASLQDANCQDADSDSFTWDGCVLPYACSVVPDSFDLAFTIKFNTSAEFTLPIKNLMRTELIGIGTDICLIQIAPFKDTMDEYDIILGSIFMESFSPIFNGGGPASSDSNEAEGVVASLQFGVSAKAPAGSTLTGTPGVDPDPQPGPEPPAPGPKPDPPGPSPDDDHVEDLTWLWITLAVTGGLLLLILLIIIIVCIRKHKKQ